MSRTWREMLSITMPSESGVSQAAAMRLPFLSMISTRHTRQVAGLWPRGSNWHRLGINIPLRFASSRMVSPSLKEYSFPLIVTFIAHPFYVPQQWTPGQKNPPAPVDRRYANYCFMVENALFRITQMQANVQPNAM
jgi:hypothetical protein